MAAGSGCKRCRKLVPESGACLTSRLRCPKRCGHRECDGGTGARHGVRHSANHGASVGVRHGAPGLAKALALSMANVTLAPALPQERGLTAAPWGRGQAGGRGGVGAGMPDPNGNLLQQIV